MTLIKTSLLNAIAVIIKMLTMLGINKILAVYVGPSGYAAIGQLQNAIQMITTFASGAINTGVTKYTAEYHEDEEKQRTVWRTAGTIALFGSLATAILVSSFSSSLANIFLHDKSYNDVFLWFAGTLVFFVFNTLLLAILNGKKEIHRYVVANIAGSLFALAVTSAMVVQYELYGALIALAIYQSLTFFVTLGLCYRTEWFDFRHFFGGIDMVEAQNLAKYTAMALTSAVCVPLSHILIRNHLGDALGWETAGYWEAMWRLSSAYLMLVTTTLGVYFLPKFSELTNPIDIRKELVYGYSLIVPVAILIAATVFLLREVIIDLLYSSEFSRMESLFGWQVIGDIFKIGSWVLAYLMLSKAQSTLYILSEVVFAFSFYMLTYVFVGYFDLVGVSMAYALNYFLYWVFLALFIGRKYCF